MLRACRSGHVVHEWPEHESEMITRPPLVLSGGVRPKKQTMHLLREWRGRPKSGYVVSEHRWREENDSYRLKQGMNIVSAAAGWLT